MRFATFFRDRGLDDALGAQMKLSHLIALGVAERWVRPIPEQSGSC